MAKTKHPLGTTNLSWEELAVHRQPGDLWVGIKGRAYDVGEWAKRHPGGELVLLSAGLDCTEAFEAYHPAWVERLLPQYCVGRLIAPTKQPDTKADVEFHLLKQQVAEAGLFEARPAQYLWDVALLITLFSAAAWWAVHANLVPAALTVACFWQQVAFIGHDAGHNAITHKRRLDSLAGLLVNAGVGIGFSWWKSTHNVHHTVVNSVDSDPDIQFMPLLAISREFFQPVFSRYHQDTLAFDSTAKRLVSVQHFTFLPLLMVAKFGLYIQTWKQLSAGKAYVHRWSEIVAQLIFACWYAAFVSCFPTVISKLAFIMLSHAAFCVLHLQICLSHFARPTARGLPAESDDWMTHQVRGTMNWSCPPWLDWFHGGLQFQIEHHLFPRMPRHNLRAASAFVKPACERLGLEYHSPTFLEAIWETLGVLREAALEARKHRLVPAEQASRDRTAAAKHAIILSRAVI